PWTPGSTTRSCCCRSVPGARPGADYTPEMAGRARTNRTLSSVGTTAGPVMVIGGAEDKVREKVLLARFAQFAGGSDAHVVVISTASAFGDRATEVYRELFLGLGLGRVSGLRPEERAEADDVAA